MHANMMWGAISMLAPPQVFKWWVPPSVMEEVNTLITNAIVTGGASVQADTASSSSGKAASTADRSSVLSFF